VLWHCVCLCGWATNTDLTRYGEIIKAPALPAPAGEVIRVATVDALYAAVDRVGPGGTILLADGHFQLSRPMVFAGKRDIAMRGASGDPAKVTLVGRGWESESRNDDLLHIARCDGVTIADLTFADSRTYGIKVEAENAPTDIHGTTRTEIVNNLVHGEIRFEGGEARLSHNLAARLEGCFVDPEAGNLELSAAATRAVDQGVPLPEVPEDIRGRHRVGHPDLGAWESKNDERMKATVEPRP
jgi:hypothetical protein